MLHPDAELRFINDVVGYGVFATRPIPKGSITWARDDFDQAFHPSDIPAMKPLHRQLLARYAYIDRHGDAILSWDHARYVNHSCEANCMSPGLEIEIAVRDIMPDEELTDDYASCNVEHAFTCYCGSPTCRGRVTYNDLSKYAAEWDDVIADAFRSARRVKQPVAGLYRDADDLAAMIHGDAAVPSCLDLTCPPEMLQTVAALLWAPSDATAVAEAG